MVVKNLEKNFKSIKAVLFGDFMLDRYTTGSINRISPEAPVPILNVEKKENKPGGAGNVALNLRALDAEVLSVGRVGDDIHGEKLISILQNEKVDTKNIFSQNNYPTSIKERFIASSQQLIRVDTEKTFFLDKKIESRIIENLPFLLNDKDVVVISDYAKGFLTDFLLKKIIKYANKKNVPIIVDPKGFNFSKYKNATMIKPNLKEAYLASKLSHKEPLDKIAKILIKETKVKNLLITKSEKGMTLFDANLTRKDFLVQAKELKDVTGAGDSVLAAISVFLANKFDINTAVTLANISAGIAIEHVGCAKVGIESIKKRVLELFI